MATSLDSARDGEPKWHAECDDGKTKVLPPLKLLSKFGQQMPAKKSRIRRRV